ncbi:aldehyde dehydrogenase family protein [Sinirhodobacter populi]|uniref:Aldehyde dehydrogenase family protein n=1 Tax=Paenirhodobacter populi TaxID=2306993 RepID=A0A443ISA4_9RHOB|nr:aldehyde dehydrogenase family protein [Sinirhodobacter populi]
MIVAEDADPLAAGLACATRKYRNSGQVCTSPTRFFAHESLCRPLTEAFLEKARSIRVGDGMDPDTQNGSRCRPPPRRCAGGLDRGAEAKGARLSRQAAEPRGLFLPADGVCGPAG